MASTTRWLTTSGVSHPEGGHLITVSGEHGLDADPVGRVYQDDLGLWHVDDTDLTDPIDGQHTRNGLFNRWMRARGVDGLLRWGV